MSKKIKTKKVVGMLFLYVMIIIASISMIGYIGYIKEAKATSIFTDGFETDDFSNWTGNTTSTGETLETTTDWKHHGYFGAKFSIDGSTTTENAYVYKNIEDQNTIYAVAYINLTLSMPVDSGNIFFIKFRNGTTCENFRIGLKNLTAIYRWYAVYYDDVTTKEITNTTPTANLNDLWLIQAYWKYGDGSGEVGFYINGSLTCSASNVNTTRYGPTSRVEVGIQKGLGNIEQILYADCIQVSDEYIEDETSQPTVTQMGMTSSLAGATPTFYSYCQAESGNLSAYIFSFDNGTDTMANDTAVLFPSDVSQAWANVTTHTLNETSNTECHWKIFLNNTDGIWGSSALQTFNTTVNSFNLTLNSSPIAVSYSINSSAYTEPSWTVPTPVTASGINSAINEAINAGGGTVYIPSGDWIINQTEVVNSKYSYGYGGAIPIDLETLPSGAWLNIIGSYTNTTIITNNGQVLKDVPSTILRSLTTQTIFRLATFSVVGCNTTLNSASPNWNAMNAVNKHIRISGLTILGNIQTESETTNTGIGMSFVDGFLIDHCVIDSHKAGIGTEGSKGLITNCVITDFYHRVIGGIAGYGVQVGGNEWFYGGCGQPTWIMDVNKIYGKYDWQGITLDWSVPYRDDVGIKGTTETISFTAGPVYIEYCQFNNTRHPCTASKYGYYVQRYCTMFGGVGVQMSDIHGGGWAELPSVMYASLGAEFYNNTFVGDTTDYPQNDGRGTYGIMIRGGASLIFNNSFVDIITPLKLGNENWNSSVPTNPYYLNNTWIWNNTFTDCSGVISVNTQQGITAGVNYFSDAPTPTDPAPPYEPYSPFIHPHPLASVGYLGQTNTTLILSEDYYTIQVFPNFVVNGTTYVFVKWEDNSTDTTRTVHLDSDLNVTAIYEVVSAYCWQFTFNHIDVDGFVVDSYISWELYNSSTLLSYSESSSSLLDGTYSLKTYYQDVLINSTDLSTGVYGNTTIPIALLMKRYSSTKYIVFNNSLTTFNLLIVSETSISFSATGSGDYKIIISSISKNATSVKKDGIEQEYGTVWLYTGSSIIINSSLSTWEISLPPSGQKPSGISTMNVVFRVFVTGEPASNCAIEIFEYVYGFSNGVVFTDETGFAEINLPQGEYNYIAELDGMKKEGYFFHVEEEQIKIEFEKARLKIDMKFVLKVILVLLIFVVGVLAILKVKARG
ncbi:MAG: hypothetical protein OEY22_01710 [Candidatus Bathyarchaeota archaeon]|nr:hypothetical protein [Candidatus Bathyarchaeota archaeon]